MHNKSTFLPVPRPALGWQASVRRLHAWSLAGGMLVGLTLAAAAHVQAQDYTYTGTTGTAAAPSASTTFTGAFTNTTTGTAFTTPTSPAGTLTFGGNTAAYAATDDIASLTLNGGLAFTNTTGNTVTVNAANGATIVAGSATLNLASGAGAVVFNPAIGLGASTLALSGGTAGVQTTLGGIISGTGGLTKAGPGTVSLNAINTFSGGTTINAGNVILAAGGGAGALRGAVTINTGGTLTLATTDSLGYNAGTVVTALNVNGGTVNVSGGGNQGFLTALNLTGGTLSATGAGIFNIAPTGTGTPGITSNASATTSLISSRVDIRNGGNLTFTVAQGTTTSGNDLTVSGVLSSLAPSAGIIKEGAGLLNFTGQNSFTGNVVINGGTVNIGAVGANTGATGALGQTNLATKTITVNSGATLSTTSNNFFGNGQNNAIQPTINVNGGTFSTTRYGTLGALNLNGATLTTNVTIDTGNFQTFALRGDVTVGGTAASTITANPATVSATTGGIHLNTNTTFTVADATGSRTADLTINAPLRNQSGDFNNIAGGLTKAGAGTMLLTAVNTYTGATAVSAGSLYVTGSTATGSAVTVNNAGTVLGGTGTVGGTITVGTGAILSAGNRALTNLAVGTLTTGALTLQTGSTFDALLAGNTSFSTLNAAGTTLLGNAAFTISLVPGATFTNGTVMQLISSDVSGQFTNASFTTGGYNFVADYSDIGFRVNVTSVPEPSTWVCGVLMVGMMGVTQRHRLNGWRVAAGA